jgi:hypothetical protein
VRYASWEGDVVHYVDDDGDESNGRLCRSMLNMLELCRMSAARLTLDEEDLRTDLLASFAQATSIIEQLIASPPRSDSAKS